LKKRKVYADIRELIQLDDAMDDETLNFGPNGGLLFCMEYITLLVEQIIFSSLNLFSFLKGILQKILNG
jgi:hypothetical protein